MPKKNMGGYDGITTRVYPATEYHGGREDGSGGKQRNSRHDRTVMKTQGGRTQKGRMSPKGARN